MQNLLRRWPAPGDRVIARGAPSRVVRVVPHRECARVDLVPLVHGLARTLLVPFDRLGPLRPPDGWRRVSLARAGLRLAEAYARTTFAGDIGALPGALAVVGWQCVAAQAVAAGDASVLLLADGVGLGKTIQAGHVLLALRQRGEGDRVLVLTPAGLREQWAAELRRLFGWDAARADPASLRAAARALPRGVNPWSLPGVTIASLDFVKQPEVLSGALETDWDVLVIDEAHQLAAATERRAAADALARRARRVLLLTATPHAGRPEDFEALCAVGRLAADPAPALLLRRGRREIGLPVIRRVRTARVRLAPAEIRLHRELHDYARAVWREEGPPAARLAMTVLLRRAASSAHALTLSLRHRARLLESRDVADDGAGSQALLAFDEPGETDAADDLLGAALATPGLASAAAEQRWLDRLTQLAESASAVESKLGWVRRFLSRGQERALIFTEYRATLHQSQSWLAGCGPLAVLHGGLSRLEREAATSAFTQGEARVLLATDVASEGLNLQAGCRLVVSLELPWNPVRLEQRIGRVDRLGQSRSVHAVHLVAHDTIEEAVLERLAHRVHAIRLALGPGDEPHAIPEASLAASGLGLEDLPRARASPRVTITRQAAAVDGDGDAERLAGAVHLHSAARKRLGSAGNCAWRQDARPVFAEIRPAVGRRLGLSPGVLLFVLVARATAGGQYSGSVLVPVHATLGAGLRRLAPAALIRAVMPLAVEHASRHARPLLDARERRHRAGVARAILRETALLRDITPTGGAPPVQAGLFERRALIEAARRQSASQERARVHRARLDTLTAVPAGADAPPEIVVALVVR